MTHYLGRSFALVALSAVCACAQSTPKLEGGAVNLYTNWGWSFGLPSVQAMVSVPGVGTAVSPLKKTLPGYELGMSVRAWKFLVPFVEVTGFDTGKAFAQVGSARSDASATTYAVNGGLRLVSSHGRLRPYAQFGGGALFQNLKGSFAVDGAATHWNGTGSVGTIL